ncbi:ligand-binding sensor domain-containing protein [Winogradskyella sp.]|uniref:ligand-binding sensor domain-containing protein n=1 Tax=Winogradskyella sp. TaxID=1883156 RepID=UPI003BA861DC
MKLKIFVTVLLLFVIVEVYTQEIDFIEVNLDSISGSQVRGLFQDSKNQVWLGIREKGIYRINNNRIFKLQLNNPDALTSFISAVEDKDKIWFSARGVMHVKDSSVTVVENPREVKSTVVFSISTHKDKLYFSGNRGVDIFENGRWLHINEANGLKHQVVHDTAVDNDGNIWFATRKGGLNMLDKGGKWHYFLPNQNCRKFLKTSSGDIWIGTSKGAVLLHPSTRETLEYYKDTAVLPQFEAKDGTVYFSSETSGIHAFSPGENVWKSFSTENSNLDDNTVYVAIQTNDGKIWIGQSQGFQVLNALSND